MESHPEWMHGQKHPLSSVVFFGEVHRSQASKAEAAALRVKAVHFSVLTLKQVLDPLCALLLQRRQLLFNLSEGGGKKKHCIVMAPDRFFDFMCFNLLALVAVSEQLLCGCVVGYYGDQRSAPESTGLSVRRGQV